jgi:hypothetical protein
VTTDEPVIVLDHAAPEGHGCYAFRPAPDCIASFVYVDADGCHTFTGETFQVSDYPRASWSRRLVPDWHIQNPPASEYAET